MKNSRLRFAEPAGSHIEHRHIRFCSVKPRGIHQNYIGKWPNRTFRGLYFLCIRPKEQGIPPFIACPGSLGYKLGQWN